LYACDRTASLITVFSVSEDGSVLSKEGFQPTETQPRGFNVDHSGKYLIAAGQKSHHISVYEIVGEQGLLHEKGRYAVGQLSLIHISEPTRHLRIAYAVFCLKRGRRHTRS
ncbi:beta-propeller fold lactonase family protein, partial [Escherichia coli]